MPEFDADGLDYELDGESANVVNVERPTSESPGRTANPADRESDREKRSDRVGNARPKGSARRKAREGEYKGSDRSL
ncbi:hypothetical protein ABZ322_36680, partial [Streptomyces sp. NPDC006129]|uniref:hypothetical protein n=1 Tax=unclassified Streptomyces TaxID=2593676 RepID=UPI00331E3936